MAEWFQLGKDVRLVGRTLRKEDKVVVNGLYRYTNAVTKADREYVHVEVTDQFGQDAVIGLGDFLQGDRPFIITAFAVEHREI